MQHGPRTTARILRSVALTAVLALGATACSGDAGGDASSSSSAKADPKKAATALDSGLKAHAAGDLSAAAADYKTALKYDPENKFAFYNLALIDASNGNYGLAEDNYRAAIKSDATYEPALFNLAILRTTADPKEAMTLYRRAVAADKKDAAAWLNLGLLLRDEGKVRAGNAAVLKAIALNPKLQDPKAPVKSKATTKKG
jgi:tetratricopeptide (TPR) repeat protein